ncbi:MAG: hypothetical protein AAGH88_15465, partial [Planctomycetota bacterium]
LSSRVFKDEAEIDAACAESWNRLTPERLKPSPRGVAGARELNGMRMSADSRAAEAFELAVIYLGCVLCHQP